MHQDTAPDSLGTEDNPMLPFLDATVSQRSADRFHRLTRKDSNISDPPFVPKGLVLTHEWARDRTIQDIQFFFRKPQSRHPQHPDRYQRGDDDGEADRGDSLIRQRLAPQATSHKVRKECAEPG